LGVFWNLFGHIFKNCNFENFLGIFSKYFGHILKIWEHFQNFYEYFRNVRKIFKNFWAQNQNIWEIFGKFLETSLQNFQILQIFWAHFEYLKTFKTFWHNFKIICPHFKIFKIVIFFFNCQWNITEYSKSLSASNIAAWYVIGSIAMLRASRASNVLTRQWAFWYFSDLLALLRSALAFREISKR
jgi:hypothetical protein